MSTSTSENENVKSLLDSDDIKVRTQGSSLYLDFNKSLFDIQIIESETETIDTYQNIVIDYPTGYTKDNCIAIGFREYIYDENDELIQIKTSFGAMYINGNYIDTNLNSIQYNSASIQCEMNHPDSWTGSFKVQIALMKIA